MQTVRVPTLAFFGDTMLELPLPDAWQVTMQPMPGDAWPTLTDDAIRAALAAPTGAPSLRELARGKRQAVIIFDDISRPTPVYRLWPFVVEELHAAGLRDEQIRFIVALGTHGAHSREDFVRKLGEEALRRFPVYNHNCYDRCGLVGTTSRGTPVEVNAEALSCDLRIGLGSVLPHPSYGFGGGPKIVLPGVASYRTIEKHHMALGRCLVEEGYGPTMRAGVAEGPLWADAAEAGRLAQIDFIVNTVLNHRREVVALAAGDLIEAWRQGVGLARRAYGTEPVDADIVIANTYGKGNEAQISASAPTGYGATAAGRDVVVIANNPQGFVIHYLQGDWGPGTRPDSPNGRGKLPPGINHRIIYNPYPERVGSYFLGDHEEQYFMSTWDEVLAQLTAWHPHGARVAVYPDLTMQYLLTEWNREG